jgi:hypothetical protein
MYTTAWAMSGPRLGCSRGTASFFRNGRRAAINASRLAASPLMARDNLGRFEEEKNARV